MNSEALLPPSPPPPPPLLVVSRAYHFPIHVCEVRDVCASSPTPAPPPLCPFPCPRPLPCVCARLPWTLSDCLLVPGAWEVSGTARSRLPSRPGVVVVAVAVAVAVGVACLVVDAMRAWRDAGGSSTLGPISITVE